MTEEKRKRPSSKHRAYMLRTCASGMIAYGGFLWPRKGYVEAPDWDADTFFGHGLHGALWGVGEGMRLSFDDGAVWMVCEIDAREVVMFGGTLAGKIKVPYAWVHYAGDRKTATDTIIALGARGAVIGASVTAGYKGMATVGYRGTATAGPHGIATAGPCGIATAGFDGMATAGVHGTAIARDGGTAMAGDCGRAIVGVRGMATAGDRGMAAAGDRGTATAGHGGTAMAGCWGTIQIRYYDFRYRVAIGYVGEDGILPDIAYKVEGGKLVKA